MLKLLFSNQGVSASKSRTTARTTRITTTTTTTTTATTTTTTATTTTTTTIIPTIPNRGLYLAPAYDYDYFDQGKSEFSISKISSLLHCQNNKKKTHFSIWAKKYFARSQSKKI